MLSTAKMIKIGEVMAWIEAEQSIALRPLTNDGDPVQLDPDQARRLARGLEELAEALESVLRQRRDKRGSE